MSVLIETSFGDITVDIWSEKAPKAALNFIKLCKMKHFNNSLFIEVQKHHIARVHPQNPTTIWELTGNDKANKYFNDEIDHQLKFKQVGYLATANKGPNLNNSQFFITLTKADLSSLNGKHTVFGRVEEGFEILRKINDSFCDKNNRPQMNVRILHTFVLDDPFEDLPEMEIPSSPQMVRDSNRLQAIQHLQMLQKYQKQDNINQTIKRQKAKKQAVTLEMLGDLPDANIKPPENILFICKLNPITQQRDLEIIFSRFGPIKSVQIVRDWKTGQSLQYGFIQFETQGACQEAYLKMNNVLIDDRRIQVDFSQSVSKLMPRNRKTNEPPKRVVKEQQSLEKPEKLVKTGRRVDDDKFNLITSRPDYKSGNKYQRKQFDRDNSPKVQLKDQQNQKSKPQSTDKVPRYDSESESKSQKQRQRKKKKDKKKKQKKYKRSSSSQSQLKGYRKRSPSESSQYDKVQKKKNKIEKQRKKEKKEKKQKKDKKDRKKKTNRSESN